MGNWDYAVIVKELQQYSGAYFDKFYICTDGSALLRLRKGKAIAIVANSNSLYVTEKPPATLETPPQFAMVVRKWLENGNLQSVEQINGDRIISFNFKNKNNENYSLVFELFGKGNTILLKGGEIIDALRREEFSSRKIKPRQKYVAPPAKKPIEEIEITDFKQSGKTIAVISSIANCPPFYIEETLARTGASNDVTQLNDSEKEKLLQELKKIKQEYAPRVYLEEGKPVAFSFTKLEKMKSEEKTFESFSEALEFYYSNLVEPKEKKKKESKTTIRLDFQKKAIEEYKNKEEENRKIAGLLYSKYAFFEELLETARKLSEEKKTEKEIEEKLAQIIEKNNEKAIVKMKNRKIELEI